MSLESGYFYQKIGDVQFTRNPTIYRRPRAAKPISRSRNLTATVTQHWAIQSSDKDIHIEFNNLDKATLDLLIPMYESALSYTFIDIYNDTYTIVISNLDWTRRRFLDSMGFRIILDMVLVT